MKTKKLSFYALGAALMLTAASCSNELPVDVNDVYDGPIQTNYLNVNIVAAGGQGTRAAGDVYDDGNAKYEDGTLVENKVESVRFYFFGPDGKAANVKNSNNTLVNYYDWTEDISQEESSSDNIESVVNATLVLQTPAGDVANDLTTIVAVVNPTEAIKAAKIGSISDASGLTDGAVTLNSVVQNFSTTGAEGTFVMTNSIYRDGNTTTSPIVEEIPVAGHLHTSAGAALADPVTIYVERVNAKARASVGLTVVKTINEGQEDAYDIYSTQVETTPAAAGSSAEGEDDLAEQTVYVRFLGWNVTCTTQKSNLMKSISAAWENGTEEGQLFGLNSSVQPWNSTDRFRSFWAANPTLAYNRSANGNDYLWGDFTTHAQAVSFTGTNYTYLQENAGQSLESPTCLHPTQLIVAAQLVDENGEALPIAEYGFDQYTPNGLLTLLAGRSNIYTRSGEEATGYTYTPIAIDNLKFVTAIEAGEGNVNTDGRYYAFVNVNPEKVTDSNYADFYIKTGDTYAQATSVDQLNEILVGLGHCKVWNEGFTYYYIDIRHLGAYTPADGDTPAKSYPGTFGIVRNHIYDMAITSLKGLGTPVVNPGEVIYPEMPKEDDTYIGAQINILNWRLVKQDVGFAWE